MLQYQGGNGKQMGRARAFYVYCVTIIQETVVLGVEECRCTFVCVRRLFEKKMDENEHRREHA